MKQEVRNTHLQSKLKSYTLSSRKVAELKHLTSSYITDIYVISTQLERLSGVERENYTHPQPHPNKAEKSKYLLFFLKQEQCVST